MLPFAAIVVAAGQGLRAGQSVPKQFAPYRGRALVAHSVQALVDAGADPVIVAIPRGAELMAAKALADLPQVRFVTGGQTRQESVYRTLEECAEFDPAYVLIHDAARPDLPREVIEDLLAALQTHHGAVPVLPVVDSLVQAGDDDALAGSVSRESMRRVQTPQAFQFHAILNAHRGWFGDPDATDDSQVLREAGGSVALVEGSERLKKITHPEDFVEEAASPLMTKPVRDKPPVDVPPDDTPQAAAHPAPTVAPALAFPRMGLGFDVHELAEGERLFLCGIELDHSHGLVGHSDADVALHAITDAVLGAVALGDIGDHFPPDDPQWEGAASSRFLDHAVQMAYDAGWQVGNVDLTLICEAPRIKPHRETMRARVAEIMQVDTSQVSIKATTSEGLGFTGRHEGIAAQAIATLVPIVSES